MKLLLYLHRRNETAEQFARRAGIATQTVRNILHGRSNPRVDIAWRIICASREQPAPRGGTVRFEDLIVEPRSARRSA